MSKRRIPVFKVSAAEGADYNKLANIPDIKKAVMDETLMSIKEAIKTKKKSISIFEISGTGYYIELNKEQFKSSLELAMEYYSEREEYDKCIECRDLKNVINE